MPNTQSKRDHYMRNRDFYIAQARQKRIERREYVQEIKNNTPCADCGIQYPYYVMQFDHTGNDKDRAIADMVGSGSLEKIKAEIAKCDLVCANCHAERTHQRRVLGTQ